MIESMRPSRSKWQPVALATLPVLLILDWLALDDITTGAEPSLVLEWSFVLASLPLLGLCALIVWGDSRGRRG